jgi:plastocyanin
MGMRKETDMKRGVFTGAFMVGLGLWLAVLGAGAGPLAAREQSKAAAVDVRIDNFSFGPTELKVAVGTTITWTNHDDIPHTVVSTDKVFKSKVLDTDDKFSFTFSTPGTFPYFCSIHPKMTGKVVVQ